MWREQMSFIPVSCALMLLIKVVSIERPVPRRLPQSSPLQHFQKPCGPLWHLQTSLLFLRQSLPRDGS
jgi:hypothetical protein